MRSLIPVLACVGLFVAVANAQYDIHFYFSEQEHANNIPPEYAGKYNPQGGKPLYLWALVEDDVGQGGNPFGEWLGVALGLDQVITGGWYQQPVLGTTRWHFYSILTWTPNYQGGAAGAFGITAFDRGLGNPDLERLATPPRVIREPAGQPPHYGAGYHYIVGEAFNAALANAFLNVGTSGIARRGGNVALDKIYFGFAPTGLPDGPLLGNQFGQKSQYPDIVPEPASLPLLGVAGVALRRR